MGASAKERKAKKKAAAQYYAEFAKLKSVPEPERMSTQNKRELEDAIGDNASGQTKNITRKIDRMSREINKDDEYKKNVKAYNDRYEILQNQIANKDTARYTISGDPAALPEKTYGLLGFAGFGRKQSAGPMAGGSNNMNQKVGIGSIGGGLNFGPKKGKYETLQESGEVYKTKEEAMAAAQKRMEEYNAGLKDQYLNKKTQNNQYIGNMFIDKSPLAIDRYVKQNTITDPNRFIKENEFKQFGVLYRNLNMAEDAVRDIEALGKKVINTKTNQLLPQYEKLNERLKDLVKRDARNVQPGNQNQSMVAGELATGKPYTETL